MKILHLLPTLDWCGGVETYILHLLPMLEARNVAQVVAYGYGRPELVARGYHIPALNSAAGRDGRIGVADVCRVIEREGPDVVHVHHINNVDAVGACLERVPTVVTTHGYQFICPASDFCYDRTERICKRSVGPACFLITWWQKCMSRNPRHAFGLYRRAAWMVRNCTRLAAIISPSRYTADRYIQAGFLEHRVHVLPYFCPIEPQREPRPEPHAPTILFMGRIQRYKGYHVFLETLGLLGGVRGLMVGNFRESTTRATRALAAKYGCVERLELRPWAARDAICSVMQESTIFVFPSLCPETLGIVGLEALACGVPVIASDVGGVREWLRDKETGLLVPPGDVGALAEALGSLLSDSDLRRRMGENGINLMREKFSPRDHVDRLIDIYEACAQDRPRQKRVGMP